MSLHELREYAQLRVEFDAHAQGVVTQLQLALDALSARDPTLAQRVIATDDNFDQAEIKFEAEILKILALYPPSASDLRLVMACLRINSYIERLADHAVNLARLTGKLHLVNDEPLPEELLAMCARTGAVSERTLHAFLKNDAELARTVVADDVLLDRLDKALQRRAETVCTEPGANHVAQAFILFRYGRELERVGDILADWCRAVIFLVTAEDVRHQKNRPAPKP